MKKLLLGDKKALSEVIGVVLLIIIVVGIAVLVYNYLELFVPKEKPECPDGISLTVTNAACKITGGTTTKGNITITIENRGRFAVDGVYIRVGPASRKVRELVNKNNLYFEEVGGLMPESIFSKIYNFSDSKIIRVGENILELEPFIGPPGKAAICENAIVSYPITCQQ